MNNPLSSERHKLSAGTKAQMACMVHVTLSLTREELQDDLRKAGRTALLRMTGRELM